MRQVMVLALVMVVAACGVKASGPSVSPVKYHCNEVRPCPVGLECYGGCCGGPPCSSEYYSPEPIDREDGGADLLVSPDMWGVIGPAVGCKSGMGYQVDSSTTACPGAFSSDPSSQCASGWSICASNPLSAQTCGLMRPFVTQGCFVGAARAADWMLPTMSATLRCSWNGATTQDYRFMVGCGSCVGWTPSAVACSGFQNLMICSNSNPGYAYHCPISVPGKDSDFLQVANNDPNSGVLCCKN